MTHDEIRTLQKSDEEGLAAFFKANNRREMTVSFHPFPLTDATAKKLCSGKGRDQFFGFFYCGSLLGLGMLRGWDEGFAIPSYGVMVDYHSQGRGIATKLTVYAIQLARELECEQVRLTVYPSNTRAVKIYETHGFKTVNTLEDDRLVMMTTL